MEGEWEEGRLMGGEEKRERGGEGDGGGREFGGVGGRGEREMTLAKSWRVYFLSLPPSQCLPALFWVFPKNHLNAITLGGNLRRPIGEPVLKKDDSSFPLTSPHANWHACSTFQTKRGLWNIIHRNSEIRAELAKLVTWFSKMEFCVGWRDLTEKAKFRRLKNITHCPQMFSELKQRLTFLLCLEASVLVNLLGEEVPCALWRYLGYFR